MRAPKKSTPVFRQDSSTEVEPKAVTVVNAISDDEILEEAQRDKVFGTDQLIVPFLKILQPLSPNVQEGLPDYNPLAKPGMFFNTATGRLYDGKTGIVLVPISHQRSYTEWVPRSEGGGFIKDWGESATAWNHLCERDQVGAYRPKTKDGHEILHSQLHYAYIVDVTTGEFNPVVFAFAGTLLKRARAWASLMANAKIQTSDGPRPAAHSYYTYKATTEIQRNDKGAWYLPKIGPNMVDEKWLSVRDIPGGAEIWRSAKMFRQSLLEGTIRTEQMENEFSGGTSTDTEEAPF
jgi:hypothetical protein